MKLLLRLFSQIILMFSTEARIGVWDRVRYIFEGIVHLFPVAIILSIFDIWFADNQTFAALLFWALFFNTLTGVFRHLKTKTFSWMDFFCKNAIIVFSVVVIYAALEIIIIILGDKMPVKYFEMLIQVTSLMYPISKVLKNVYIISDKKYPPKWLMQRVYNFEKSGDLEKFFNNEK